MKAHDTVFTSDDLQKLESVIKNIKDPKARKNLVNLQQSLKKKLKVQKQPQNKKCSISTFYFIAIPFTILFAVLGVYYFVKKDNIFKDFHK